MNKRSADSDACAEIACGGKRRRDADAKTVVGAPVGCCIVQSSRAREENLATLRALLQEEASSVGRPSEVGGSSSSDNADTRSRSQSSEDTPVILAWRDRFLREIFVEAILQLGDVYAESVKGCTIGLAVTYLDRCFFSKNFDEHFRQSMHLPLVCFLIACKFEEVQSPVLCDLQNFVLQRERFQNPLILQSTPLDSGVLKDVEILVLECLGMSLNAVTHTHFINRLLSISTVLVAEDCVKTVRFLDDLAYDSFETWKFRPSVVAKAVFETVALLRGDEAALTPLPDFFCADAESREQVYDCRLEIISNLKHKRFVKTCRDEHYDAGTIRLAAPTSAIWAEEPQASKAFLSPTDITSTTLR